MNKMALNLIAEIMGWQEDSQGIATREYARLNLMSALKYDGYSDFRAGVRFVESLAAWLKQFDSADRPVAYEFVKLRLVYISTAELHCVIEAFVPEVVTPHLRNLVAGDLKMKPYRVWSTSDGYTAVNKRLRKILFVGMSDGSRVDVLRRATRRLSTEQVVPMMNIDDEKWRDLAAKLSEDQGAGARFDSVYLIDDFTASGTTFIRRNSEGEWKGKLKKFNDLVRTAKESLGEQFPIRDKFSLHIHHYVSSAQARAALLQRLAEADAAWTEKSHGQVIVTEGMLLPESTRLNTSSDGAMLDLCRGRYHDHELFKRLEKHCREAGQTDMKLGYADCALPIVLDHNTPNNSIPLLWAETSGENGAHAMRPLFRRRDRHG